jgi:hypothetical protein
MANRLSQAMAAIERDSFANMSKKKRRVSKEKKSEV